MRRRGAQLFGGALTAGLMALITGGLFGVASKKKEAEDQKVQFAIDSMLGGFGGPLVILKRMAEKSETGQGV